MFMRENWGTVKECRVCRSLSVTHETVSNINAPLYNGKLTNNTYSMLIIHISGDVTYCTSYGRYRANALDIFSVDTDEIYCEDWGHKIPYERFVIYFDNYLFDRIITNREDKNAMLGFLDHKNNPYLITLNEQFKDELILILNEIEPKLGSSASSSVIPVFAGAVKIFELIFRAMNASGNNYGVVASSNLTGQAVQYINSNFKELSDTKEIADRLHVNPEYLAKKFKKEMGISIKNYILDKKLACSREFLKLGQNVTEAAISAGFTNVSYFIQLYKNKYGVTPGKVQKDKAR